MIWSLVSSAMNGIGIIENQARKYQSVVADAYEANRVARVIRVVRWDRKGYSEHDGGNWEVIKR